HGSFGPFCADERAALGDLPIGARPRRRTRRSHAAPRLARRVLMRRPSSDAGAASHDAAIILTPAAKQRNARTGRRRPRERVGRVACPPSSEGTRLETRGVDEAGERSPASFLYTPARSLGPPRPMFADPEKRRG